jgi:hypothetical protein
VFIGFNSKVRKISNILFMYKMKRRENLMAKITVEAVLKVLEYAALAIYGVVKVCKKETDTQTKKE